MKQHPLKLAFEVDSYDKKDINKTLERVFQKFFQIIRDVEDRGREITFRQALNFSKLNLNIIIIIWKCATHVHTDIKGGSISNEGPEQV